MSRTPGSSLKALLDSRYRSFDAAAHVARDPLQFAHRHADPADQEAAAFVATSLAFGRVAAFAPILEGIFEALGAHPTAALREADPATFAAATPRKYR